LLTFAENAKMLMNRLRRGKMKKNLSFHVYAIITIICWSLSFVLSRLVMRELSSESLGFLRYLIASIVLLCLIPFYKLRKVELKDLWLIILTGASGFFLYMIAFNKGVKEVNAATSSVIIATVPMITALLSRVFYKEKIKVKQWLAMGVSFLGVIIITILSKGFTITNGLNWLFLAAVLLAMYNLLQKKLVQKYSAIQSTMMSIFSGTIMLLIFLPNTVSEVRGISFSSVIFVLIMGGFSSAIAYVSWTKAFEVAENIASVSNYMYVTPFLTTALGLVIAREFPDLTTIIGGLIILIGLVLFNIEQLFPKKFS
jgi:drug/metabolite transporter (DMT)-like permease